MCSDVRIQCQQRNVPGQAGQGTTAFSCASFQDDIYDSFGEAAAAVFEETKSHSDLAKRGFTTALRPRVRTWVAWMKLTIPKAPITRSATACSASNSGNASVTTGDGASGSRPVYHKQGEGLWRSVRALSCRCDGDGGWSVRIRFRHDAWAACTSHGPSSAEPLRFLINVYLNFWQGWPGLPKLFAPLGTVRTQGRKPLERRRTRLGPHKALDPMLAVILVPLGLRDAQQGEATGSAPMTDRHDVDNVPPTSSAARFGWPCLFGWSHMRPSRFSGWKALLTDVVGEETDQEPRPLAVPGQLHVHYPADSYCPFMVWPLFTRTLGLHLACAARSWWPNCRS